MSKFGEQNLTYLYKDRTRNWINLERQIIHKN